MLQVPHSLSEFETPPFEGEEPLRHTLSPRGCGTPALHQTLWIDISVPDTGKLRTIGQASTDSEGDHAQASLGTGERGPGLAWEPAPEPS